MAFTVGFEKPRLGTIIVSLISKFPAFGPAVVRGSSVLPACIIFFAQEPLIPFLSTGISFKFFFQPIRYMIRSYKGSSDGTILKGGGRGEESSSK